MLDRENNVSLLEQEVSKERKKLSSDRMDISFGELINLYKNKELVIRPEYQRLYRWSPKQKTALIESILLSIPIPPIFVSEDKDGIWELIDGLQRVSTFISFFGELDRSVSEIKYSAEDAESSDEESISIGNKWVLQEGGLIKSLEGFNIDTLPSQFKINLKRAVCRVEILRWGNNAIMQHEMFKRLNSGGTKLSPQEIRNIVYRGINPKLNELFFKISQSPKFKKLTGLTSAKLSTLYDQELVLRFFAFYNNIDNINENTENFLNQFMAKSVIDSSFNYLAHEEIFNKCLDLLEQLDDDKVFKNSNNAFVPSYYEGIVIGIAQNIEKLSVSGNKELLKMKIKEFKTYDDFNKKQENSVSSKLSVKKRLARANEIFQS